jgi:hypothetical protein
MYGNRSIASKPPQIHHPPLQLSAATVHFIHATAAALGPRFASNPTRIVAQIIRICQTTNPNHDGPATTASPTQELVDHHCNCPDLFLCDCARPNDRWGLIESQVVIDLFQRRSK